MTRKEIVKHLKILRLGFELQNIEDKNIQTCFEALQEAIGQLEILDTIADALRNMDEE